MGKIVISTNVSLDGVVQDPDGEEGFSRGGWFVQYGGKDLAEWGQVEYAGRREMARARRFRRAASDRAVRHWARPTPWPGAGSPSDGR